MNGLQVQSRGVEEDSSLGLPHAATAATRRGLGPSTEVLRNKQARKFFIFV
jgi:hypothetical protein